MLWKHNLTTKKQELLVDTQSSYSLNDIVLSPSSTKLLMTFSTRDGSNNNIKIVDLSDANITIQLPFTNSQNGKWMSEQEIIFRAKTNDNWSLYKIDLSNQSEPVLFIDKDVLHFEVENKTLFYSLRGDPSLYVYNLESFNEIVYRNIFPTTYNGSYWAVDNGDVIYLEYKQQSSYRIVHTLDSGKITESKLLNDLILNDIQGFYLTSKFSKDKDVFLSVKVDSSEVFISELRVE